MHEWNYSILGLNAIHDSEKSFEEKRNGVVDLILGSDWVADLDVSVGQDRNPVRMLAYSLREADDVEMYDLVLDMIYDQADVYRAWIF